MGLTCGKVKALKFPQIDAKLILLAMSQKDPKAFAKVLEKVKAKVDTSYLSIGPDGNSRGDLEKLVLTKAVA